MFIGISFFALAGPGWAESADSRALPQSRARPIEKKARQRPQWLPAAGLPSLDPSGIGDVAGTSGLHGSRAISNVEPSQKSQERVVTPLAPSASETSLLAPALALDSPSFLSDTLPLPRGMTSTQNPPRFLGLTSPFSPDNERGNRGRGWKSGRMGSELVPRLKSYEGLVPSTLTAEEMEQDLFDQIRLEMKRRLPIFDVCARAARRRGTETRRVDATWIINADGSIKALLFENMPDLLFAECLRRVGNQPFVVQPGKELKIPTPIVFVR